MRGDEPVDEEPSRPGPGGRPKADTGFAFEMTSLLFATMFPQTVVALLGLAPLVVVGTISKDLGVPATLAGVYTGLIYFFAVVGNLFSPTLIARFGPARLGYLTVVIAGIALCVFAIGSWAAILLAIPVLGACYGPLTPASSELMSHQSGSPRFSFLVSVRQSSVPLGGALAGIAAPITLLMGWHNMCLVLGLAATVAGLLSLALAPSGAPRNVTARPARKSEGLFAVVAHINRRPSLVRLSWAAAIFATLQLILSGFLVTHLTTNVDLSLNEAAALFGLSQVAGVLARLVWGTLADLMRRPRLLLVGLAFGMATASFALSLLPHGMGLIVPGLISVLYGATASGWNGVLIAQLMRASAPSEASLTTSGGLVFIYGGIVVGPPIFAALAYLIGLPGAFACSTLLALVAAFMIYIDVE